MRKKEEKREEEEEAGEEKRKKKEGKKKKREEEREKRQGSETQALKYAHDFLKRFFSSSLPCLPLLHFLPSFISFSGGQHHSFFHWRSEGCGKSHSFFDWFVMRKSEKS